MPVSVFCVLQSTGVTPLKCGEIYHKDFVANYMENKRVKKMKIGQNLSQSYERMYSSTVFLRHVIVNLYQFARLLWSTEEAEREIAERDNARHENAGHENRRHETVTSAGIRRNCFDRRYSYNSVCSCRSFYALTPVYSNNVCRPN